ncbi:TPA: site-specific integrase [Salmonella enterica subsp. enterica serovar Enteritidis]|uniref:tyrosine-type recombinase/integrase n=1 Tax=Salmonella enterica TaxID=28901 RepID=UPI0002A6C7A2|nr:site-specific integrase [Salmonella enterica]ELO83276.1 putative recombinase [Salmonella enterica subsp. enterica serovar Enteritidis str. SARB17]HAE4697422.1 site-specific integrase [Salmonella enterica subsp. enterica serovar Enteritidis]HAU6874379.1 site-specific integrase [Salmonella enterica subsp. enterica serovar Enteritidis]
MALSDTKLRTLTPRNRPWQLADHDGLVIEVLPTGRKIWRFRYRFDNKSQKITLGEYPAFSLAEARLWREKCRSMVVHGINPAQKKQEVKLKQKDPTARQTLALHLLIICMVRKSDLIEATWSEVNFNSLEWRIPGERMKMDNLLPLSKQALAMFEELKFLAGDSPYVFPSRNDHRRPISKTTLNCAVRTLDLNVRDFVIHDFRRTANTLLHEQGYNSDWVEKCLAHKIGGVRGIYNRAEYLNQRREMLQSWADFVDAQIETGRKVIIGQFGKSYNVTV